MKQDTQTSNFYYPNGVTQFRLDYLNSIFFLQKIWNISLQLYSLRIISMATKFSTPRSGFSVIISLPKTPLLRRIGCHSTSNTFVKKKTGRLEKHGR